MVHKKPRGRPPKDEERRRADRRALVDAAVAILREGGAPALTARRVAERAGAALGSVYNGFESLEALRLEANAVTMRLLRDALVAALASCREEAAAERLLCLARAYLAFAAEHHHSWAALFEPRTMEPPPAIAADIAGLFGLIEDVLRDVDRTEARVAVMARALWASVHGMVYLGEVGALGPIGPRDVGPMIDALVRSAVAGFEAGRASAPPRAAGASTPG